MVQKKNRKCNFSLWVKFKKKKGNRKYFFSLWVKFKKKKGNRKYFFSLWVKFKKRRSFSTAREIVYSPVNLYQRGI
jgi:plasmid maintenance system killer protein